ncbi:dTDP-4-dehydrorhamnose reductase [Atopococcus tabaci]|uniref:dTDP-4-dehydrorhamnose reductase n=1 Tax=Atopococcus tabaci TaxID=269774 RepID=UPI00040FB869|nr:dTDP-4-dehydrorhamnose reductase [Atopococcus tabaci]
MKALVTGANGQLGKEVQKLLQENGIDFIAAGRQELDITNEEESNSYIQNIQPSVVYHCAAYTNVEQAEDEGKEENWLVNVEGTKNVAKAAEAVGAKMVYISTDYVFDGKDDREYTTDHETNPINEYGKAKLAGEKAVQEICSAYYIIRTSWVFGEFGSNFVYTMKRLARKLDKLTVVNDQTGRPTWTRTLAEFMLYAVKNDVPTGIYHLSNDDSCTWYEFATEILKEDNVEIEPVDSSAFVQKAERPKHSKMDLSSVKNTDFHILPWKEALGKFLNSVDIEKQLQ